MGAGRESAAGMWNRLMALGLSACVVGSGSASILAQRRADKKLSDAQKREVQGVVQIVDDASAGQPAPDDFKVEWIREDFLKAEDRKEYVAFTVTVDTSKIAGSNLSLFWRVTKTGTTGPVADEDVSFVPISAGSTAFRVSRSFTVPAGTYDVVVAAREPTPAGKTTTTPKASLLKRTITVPDFWNGELSTSSVIVVQRIDSLPAPLPSTQQIDRPYAMGSVELVPAWDTRFPKRSELETFFLIYNPRTDDTNKPNVTVEYTVYTGTGGGARVFAKTRPVALNAQTLQRFDVAAGDQLQAGRIIPLASLPEGDYRLEIRITDKIASKSLTRDLNFTVTAS
jgi:hypothetical protein